MFRVLCCLKLFKNLTNPARLHMPKDSVVNLYHWGKSATTKTCNLFYGVFPVRGGNLTIRNAQFTDKGIIDIVSTFYMTGSTNTHLDSVFAIGSHSKLRVERCYTNKLSTVNIRAFIYPVKSIRRQIAELLLYSLKQWNYSMASSTNSINDSISP